MKREAPNFCNEHRRPTPPTASFPPTEFVRPRPPTNQKPRSTWTPRRDTPTHDVASPDVRSILLDTRLKTSGRSDGDGSDQPIQRSPADILRLVVAAVVVLILLVVEWLFGDTLVAFASDLLRGLDAIPQWIVDVIVIGTRVLGVIVLGGGLVWILYRRRWRMLVTVALAGLVAVALFGLLDALVETDQRADLVEVDVDLGPLTTEGYVSTAGIAAVAAILTAAAPWLGRRWRRAGWALIVGLVVTAFIHAPVSFDSMLAWVVGWLCGAAVLVVGGAPSRRPTVQAVIDGLDAVGLPVQQLDRAGVDARGSTPYFGVGADGTKLFVKALGTDERSADLLFRLYRGLLPHNFGDEKPFSSLRRSVEHEAFVALTASALGGAHAGVARVRDGRAERLRPGLRGDRGQVPRPPRPERGLRRRLGGHLGSRRSTARPPHRPSRPPPGEHLPRRRRSRLADRLRLQRGRRLRSAARHRRRRAARVVERLRRGGTGGRPRRGRRSTERRWPAPSTGSTGGPSAARRGRRSRPARASSTISATGWPTRSPPPAMNLWWLIVAGVGLVIVSLSVAAARQPSISPAESRVFHAVNGLPDGLYPFLWLPMQLGNLVVGTVAGLAGRARRR